MFQGLEEEVLGRELDTEGSQMAHKMPNIIMQFSFSGVLAANWLRLM